MSNTIENEIVRLLKEISDDEKELVNIENEAENVSRTEYFSKGYARKIKSKKESLNRKMQLLRSLQNIN